MGRAYSKQSDVVIASWAAGVEVLISTKTMLSSYQKNLRNRFEEAYGDAKNLRGRHPLASLGFLFVAGGDIPARLACLRRRHAAQADQRGRRVRLRLPARRGGCKRDC